MTGDKDLCHQKPAQVSLGDLKMLHDHQGGYGGDAKLGRMDSGTGDCNEIVFPDSEGWAAKLGCPH